MAQVVPPRQSPISSLSAQVCVSPSLCVSMRFLSMTLLFCLQVPVSGVGVGEREREREKRVRRVRCVRALRLRGMALVVDDRPVWDWATSCLWFDN